MDELPSIRRWGLRKQEGHELSADVTASLHAGILVVICAGPGVPSGSSRLQGFRGEEVLRAEPACTCDTIRSLLKRI